MNSKPNTDLIMYTTDDGLTKVEATFDNDTVWLSIDQMAELFQRDKSTISRHIKNSVCFLATKRHGTVKNLVNTDFLPFEVLKSASNFNDLVPKWCPNFLQRYKTIQADVKKYHNYRGRKHSLLSLSCLPYKHNHMYLSMAGKARSS